jgi:hypothetical protein
VAKNTGRTARTGVRGTDGESPRAQPSGGLWKRNLVTGRFTESKRTGGAFKSARRTGSA